jgi:hypothetical protein
MNNNTYFNDVIPYLVDYFEQFGTLPTKAIECTKTHESYTAFGSNLQKKVEKAGGIEKLLRNFVGRGARKQINAKIEKRVKADRKKPTITIDGEVVQDLATA